VEAEARHPPASKLVEAEAEAEAEAARRLPKLRVGSGWGCEWGAGDSRDFASAARGGRGAGRDRVRRGWEGIEVRVRGWGHSAAFTGPPLCLSVMAGPGGSSPRA